MLGVSSAANSKSVYLMMAEMPKRLVGNYRTVYLHRRQMEINTIGNTTQHDATIFITSLYFLHMLATKITLPEISVQHIGFFPP
jgi:hypothetical protein